MEMMEQSFGNYIYDNENKSLFEKLKSLSKNELCKYSPVGLFGDIGTGKTCLLNAIKDKLQGEHPELKILSINAESYLQEFITSLKNGTLQDFKEEYRSLDALFIDDLDYLKFKDSTQEELYYTLKALMEKGSVIVYTSIHSLKQKVFSQRLASILKIGFNIETPQPSEEIKVSKIKQFFHDNYIALEESDIIKLASQAKNMFELEGLLKKTKFLEQCKKQ
ncbi:MAG: ATP-binding protein [Treponema sp.]|jgi:chromosomal replication initiator protein|nr:ATP-binding protein [Treponema sp.]